MYRPIIALLIMCLTSCSTYHELEGIYYTDNQDCIVLDGRNNSLLESHENGIIDFALLHQSRNKLKFIGPTHGWLFFRKSGYRFTFRILGKTTDSFTLVPISKHARDLFNNKPYLIFTTKYHFADQTNYFTRLQFHSSNCFGCCDDLHLTLDYSGNLKVTNRGNIRSGCSDSIRNDNYLGKLSYEDLEKLRTILKYSRLKTLDWPKQRPCWDAPDLTLILHQQDTTYHFHMNGHCLPIVSRELTGFLGELFSHPSLRKVDTTWKYEAE